VNLKFIHFTSIQTLGQLGYNNITYSAKYEPKTAMRLGLKQDIRLFKNSANSVKMR